jgi:hypothetical protein
MSLAVIPNNSTIAKKAAQRSSHCSVVSGAVGGKAEQFVFDAEVFKDFENDRCKFLALMRSDQLNEVK